jgi:aspartyl protease family protein
LLIQRLLLGCLVSGRFLEHYAPQGFDMRALPTCGVFVLTILSSGGIAVSDELAEARGELEKAGIRVFPLGVALAKEADLSKELGKAPALKRTVLLTERELRSAEQQAENLQRGLTMLKAQQIQLSAQLAGISRNDVTLNNRLVGALKAIEGQFDLGKDQQRRLDEQVKAARSKANNAREAYIELVLGIRRLADEIEAEYTAKAADSAVRSSLDRFNKAAGKQFTLAVTPLFQANQRRLKLLEDTVLSEAIELRDEGKTMRVDCMVNGKYPQEMVLDSGASLISLPLSMAEKFGLRPGDKDPKIILQLADGREIEGWQMKLASVRVGKFTVENVECAVLSEAAIAAEPLLGMSFLEHFKFEIDSAGRKLTMVKVSGTEGSSKK